MVINIEWYGPLPWVYHCSLYIHFSIHLLIRSINYISNITWQGENLHNIYFNEVIWVAVILPFLYCLNFWFNPMALFLWYKLATLREITFSENICSYFFNVHIENVQETMIVSSSGSKILSNRQVWYYCYQITLNSNPQFEIYKELFGIYVLKEL